jgi:hypothetical protein
MIQWRWPLPNVPKLLPDTPGRFGAVRKHDVHTGVDLYCAVSAKVVAVEAGEVVAIEPFTGPDAASPWWLSTEAVLVEGASGVVVYGEVHPEVQVGDQLEAGDRGGRPTGGGGSCGSGDAGFAGRQGSSDFDATLGIDGCWGPYDCLVVA